MSESNLKLFLKNKPELTKTFYSTRTQSLDPSFTTYADLIRSGLKEIYRIENPEETVVEETESKYVLRIVGGEGTSLLITLEQTENQLEADFDFILAKIPPKLEHSINSWLSDVNPTIFGIPKVGLRNAEQGKVLILKAAKCSNI